jgi:hypothetical protein
MSPSEEDSRPPPGPKMRRPSDKTWPTRECRFSEPTKDSYASGSQLSSAILRLARAALSAEELAEWLTCRRHIAPISPKEGTTFH